MAVTVTDRRTILTEADTVTGWTNVGFGTTTSDIAESTAAVAEAINIGNQAMYFTAGASINLSNTLVYVYSFNSALQPAWDASPPANALFLGDGTDQIAFDMAGSNRRVFNHLDGPTSWQCLVLDGSQASTMNGAGNTYVVSGSFAGLALTAITQVGAYHTTQSKAIGGGYNVACDIIRYGNNGIRITAGGVGTEGTFSEIAVADRSTANQAAHGILRALSSIAFGVQGPLTFGNSGAATTSYFEDSGVVVIFENRNIGNDKYYFNVEGNTGSTNSFVLTGSTITSAGPHVGIDASGGNINTLTLDSCTFAALGNRAILFSSNADATGHTVNACTFDGCGKITVGSVDFTRNTVANSAATDNALIYGGGIMTNLTISGYEGTAGTAAILSNQNIDMDGELDGLNATKGTAATAVIELGANTPSSITLRNWTVSGYNAANGNNDSVIYNNSGTSVTVNVIGNTGTISYRNGAGASTTIVANPVTLTVNVTDTDAAPISGARVLVWPQDNTDDVPFDESVSITRSGSTATVTHTGHGFSTGQYSWIEGADQVEYNGVHQITVTDANTYTYTVSGTPTTPATGTITATGAIINGTTDGSGQITDTRSYSVDQAVQGRVRAASGSPYYKANTFTGSISSSAGLTVTVQLSLDE